MAAPKLFNNATQQWDIVPDHTVTDHVAQGRYSFESGIDVPVVAPDGTMGSVPSQNVQDAFQNGYRWATDADKKANIDAQNEAIMDKNYGPDHTLEAFGLGVAQGAIPGANQLMQGMASVTGHNPNDVTQGIQQLEGRHGVANFAGNLAGAIASPITEAFGGGARAAGEALGASMGAGKVATKAIGSALEGGYFGLHEGINESALGDPHEIAETLMSSAGRGLIFGGVAGAGLGVMGEAARPIKNFIGDKVDALAQASKKTAQVVAKGTTLSTLPDAVRKAADDLLSNEDLRNVIYNGGGLDAVRKMSDEIASSTAELKQQSSGFLQDLKDFVKRSPKATQDKIDTALNNAGGDFYGATQDAFNAFRGQKESLMADMLSDQSPGVFMEDVDKGTGKLIKTLAASSDRDAQALAGDLHDYLEAQKTAHGMGGLAGRVESDGPWQRVVYPQDAYAAKVSVGKEMNIMQTLREKALSGVDALPDDLQGKVRGFHSDLTDLMESHPTYGSRVTDMDQQYGAMDMLRGFLNDKTGNVTDDVMARMKTDPEFAHELDSMMGRFPDIAPILQNFKNSLEDPLASQVHLNALKQAVRDAGANTYGRLTSNDYISLAKMVGDENIGQKAEKLRQVQAALEGQGAGPITKLTAMLRALGRPVPDIFAKLEPHQSGLDKLMGVLGKSGDQTVIEKALKKGAFSVVKGAMMNAVGGAIGGAIGHTFLLGPIGVVAGSLTASLIRRMFNPVSGFEALTKLEGKISKNAARMKDATNFAIDALTSKEAVRTTAKAGGFTALSHDEKRANWSARQKFLTELKDPDRLMQVAGDRLGTSQAAPNITAAMHAQFSRTATFLTDKMPQDPLAHLSLNAHDTGWKPSDMDLARFERYHMAAVDPEGALKNVGLGKGTKEELETLETLYPTHFQRLQEGLLDAIMSPDTKLSFSQRQAIGSMFGIASSASTQPTFIAAMQQNLAKQAQGGPKQQALPQNPKVRFDPQSNSTEVDRITYT